MLRTPAHKRHGPLSLGQPTHRPARLPHLACLGRLHTNRGSGKQANPTLSGIQLQRASEHWKGQRDLEGAFLIIYHNLFIICTSETITPATWPNHSLMVPLNCFSRHRFRKAPEGTSCRAWTLTCTLCRYTTARRAVPQATPNGRRRLPQLTRQAAKFLTCPSLQSFPQPVFTSWKQASEGFPFY